MSTGNRSLPTHPQARPMAGITRYVAHAFPGEVTNGKRRYRYLLECGHIVQRNIRDKQWCYCAACLMAGDR